jgi:hypothetical protein
MNSIQCVQENMQIPAKLHIFGFWHAFDEKGGKFAVSKHCLAL